MHALKPQQIEQLGHVPTQALQRVGSGRNAGSAMPASVVAQDAEALRQRRHFGVPHTQRRADGVRQHQHRLAGGAIQAIGETSAVTGGEIAEL
ncbi:hypothetical protein D9M69_545030 [compost metagenome]